jgi:Rod binding domain-containing protein
LEEFLKTTLNKNFIGNMKEKSGFKNSNKYIPSAFKKVAEGMEKQFLEYVLNKMKKTVPTNGQNSTEKSFYESLLTSRQAKAMSHGDDGVGIKKVILDQIYPQRLRNKITFEHYEKPIKKKHIQRTVNGNKNISKHNNMDKNTISSNYQKNKILNGLKAYQNEVQ